MEVLQAEQEAGRQADQWRWPPSPAGHTLSPTHGTVSTQHRALDCGSWSWLPSPDDGEAVCDHEEEHHLQKQRQDSGEWVCSEGMAVTRMHPGGGTGQDG
jgi:hypothetical protein